MSDLQQRITLLHYDIWRFERWVRSLVFGERRITTIKSSPSDADDLDDSNPFSLHNELPNYSGKHISFLTILFLLVILNSVFAFLRVGSAMWLWGIVAVVVVGFVAGLFVAPTDRGRYLNEFKKLELMSETEKRKSAVKSALIVGGIWVLSIASFAYYLRLSKGP